MGSDLVAVVAGASRGVGKGVAPGLVRTELVDMVPRGPDGRRMLTLPGEQDFDVDAAETPRFTGRAVVALLGDAARWSGRAVSVADLADAYDFTDVDGRRPRNPPPG